MEKKKVKKLAFGGMSNMRNNAAQMAAMAKRPQAPASRTDAEAALGAKAAMAQKAGMSKNAPTLAALLASKQAGPPQMAAANPLQKMGSGPSRQAMMKKGGKVHSDVAMDKKVVKKAVKMHDDQLHGGKKTNLTKLAKGGVAKTVTKEMEYDYKTGKKSFSGSTAKRDAHAEKEGKRVAKDLAYDKAKKFARGGGIEVRGKTKGTMVKMKKGGYC